MKQYVIFDLDGTLLDTIADLADATNYALEQLGYTTHPITAYNYMVGNGVTKLLERALPEDMRTTRMVEAMRCHFLEYYDVHCTDRTTIYPGISDLLDELAARGIATAVTSNKYQRAVTHLISHFFGQLPWAAILGHQENVPVKPDPSIVFMALNAHPTPKDNVLYVGDSAVDMETAQRAGVESVGVSWGFRTRSELSGAGADHVVDSPDDILSLL